MTTKVKAADLLKETITPMRVPTKKKVGWRRYDQVPFRVRVAKAKADLEKVPEGGYYGHNDRGVYKVEVVVVKYGYELDVDRDKYIVVKADTYYTVKEIEAGDVGPGEEVVVDGRLPYIIKKQIAVIDRIGVRKTEAGEKNEVEVKVKDTYEFFPNNGRYVRNPKTFNTLDGAKKHLATYVNRKLRAGAAPAPLAVRKAKEAARAAEQMATYTERNAERHAAAQVDRAKREVENLAAKMAEAEANLAKAEAELANTQTKIKEAKAKATVAKAKADLLAAAAA